MVTNVALQRIGIVGSLFWGGKRKRVEEKTKLLV